MPLSFKWKGHKIADEFAWDGRVKDVIQMKAFALSLLADLLGPKFDAYTEADVEGKLADDRWDRILLAGRIRDSEVCSGQRVLRGDPLRHLRGRGQRYYYAAHDLGYGLAGEYVVRIHLDYTDRFIQLRDEFDWDLACPLNLYPSYVSSGSPEQFARNYVAEHSLPFVYQSVIARLIRVQLTAEKCRIYSDIQKSTASSQMAAGPEFYSLPTLERLLPNTEEHWDVPMFSGPLADQLGPLGPFKYAGEHDDDPKHVPDYLRNRSRSKVFRIIEDLRTHQHLTEEKEEEASAKQEVQPETVAEEPKKFFGKTGLSIVYNKRTHKAEVMQDWEAEQLREKRDTAVTEEDGESDTRRRKLSSKRKRERKARPTPVPVPVASDPQKGNGIKIDLRQLQTEGGTTQ